MKPDTAMTTQPLDPTPSATDDPLTRRFEFDVTFADLRAANKYRALHGWPGRWAALVLIGGAEASILLVFANVVFLHHRLFGSPGFWNFLAGFVALIAFEVWRECLTLPLVTRKVLGRLGRRTVTTSIDFVEITSAFGTTRLRWSAFTTVANYRGSVIFSLESRDMIALPASAFSSASDANSFTAATQLQRRFDNKRLLNEPSTPSTANWPPAPVIGPQPLAAPAIALDAVTTTRYTATLSKAEQLKSSAILTPWFVVALAISGTMFVLATIALKYSIATDFVLLAALTMGSVYSLLGYYYATAPLPHSTPNRPSTRQSTSSPTTATSRSRHR